MQDHWETIYEKSPPGRMSWFRPHLETSLALIRRAVPSPASIIDIGAGASTLVDDLLALGYQNLAVLDIAQPALSHARDRLGEAACRVRWIQADVLSASLPSAAYDLWHDRALFHFFTAAEDRAAYVRQVTHALRRQGHLILSTFATEGPERCSGLPVVRYSAESLRRELGPGFRLLSSSIEMHETPFGTRQQFLLCHAEFIGPLIPAR